jgi:rhodanese-related sulfurtransferase
MNKQLHRDFKNALYEQFARISKALANPRRLELIDLLAQGERTVEDLAREANLSIANASQHLQELRAAQLVSVRRDGLYAYYRLADEKVFRTWQALRDLGEARLSELQRVVTHYLAQRDEFEPVSADELLDRVQRREVMVLDVRPEKEFRAGHITGAISAPIETLERQLRKLSKRKEIVAYCRGPYCVFSDEAVELLRRRGFRARRLATGFPDWQAAGMPIEHSTPT